MKKVAIMTWYSYENYGSKLQATAMLENIKKRKLNPTFINYIPRGIIKPHNESMLKKIARFSKHILSRKRNIIISNPKFKEYSKKYFSETDLCDSYIDLEQLNEQFDAFVCGSDQIWSPNNFDPRYFLDFANKEKIIAYAPSIGFSSIEDLKIKNEMKRLINRFDYLSIREETGAKLIKEICNKEAKVVLDPTLLLNNKDWEKYEDKGTDAILKNQEYILTYYLGPSDKYINSIEKYAKDNNLKIYNIPVYKNRKINKYNYPDTIGPSEFLSLIKNSKCVFTDSFHGIIFSINYNVNFYAYKRFNATSKINQNSRVVDILNRLSLQDRLIENNSILKNDNIDYKKINPTLEIIRKDSSDYLDYALKTVTERESIIDKKTGKNLSNYCSGCGACAAICPVNAISIEKNTEGFQSYKINEDKCIKCGLCIKVCPMLKLNASKIKDCKDFYSFKSKDETILLKSSSGGVAHTISSMLNADKYYICGCTYNNSKDVAEHIIISPNHLDELKKLQGSKYIQSHSADAIKKCIDIGKDNKVLFIGTPCQIAGIDKITREKNIRDNFVLIDLICHGVPTDYLWKKYLNELFMRYPILKTKHSITIRTGTLTSKQRYNIMMMDKNNNIIYNKNQSNDLFYSFFNDGTCYNKSCFECPYRTKSSADIRIGDYWGNRFKNDTTGISMVVAMTDKGVDIINKVKANHEAEILEQDIEDYFKAQYPINRSIPIYRDDLINDLKNNKLSLSKIKNKYFKYQKFINNLYKIKKIIKR